MFEKWKTNSKYFKKIGKHAARTVENMRKNVLKKYRSAETKPFV